MKGQDIRKSLEIYVFRIYAAEERGLRTREGQDDESDDDIRKSLESGEEEVRKRNGGEDYDYLIGLYGRC